MSARLYQINITTILGPMTYIDINVINILLIYLFGEYSYNCGSHYVKIKQVFQRALQLSCVLILCGVSEKS